MCGSYLRRVELLCVCCSGKAIYDPLFSMGLATEHEYIAQFCDDLLCGLRKYLVRTLLRCMLHETISALLSSSYHF